MPCYSIIRGARNSAYSARVSNVFDYPKDLNYSPLGFFFQIALLLFSFFIPFYQLVFTIVHCSMNKHRSSFLATGWFNVSANRTQRRIQSLSCGGWLPLKLSKSKKFAILWGPARRNLRGLNIMVLSVRGKVWKHVYIKEPKEDCHQIAEYARRSEIEATVILLTYWLYNSFAHWITLLSRFLNQVCSDKQDTCSTWSGDAVCCTPVNVC